MIVSNSTVLIYLSKLNKLIFLRVLFKQVLIPNAVYKEVVTEGLKRNYSDAKDVENAIKDGWTIVKDVKIVENLKKKVYLLSGKIG